ncbi:hypothetical protein QBC43DRAFT_318942 [Cladorrhinum sp. PSN259]|nr:hypothetical protein QBC43DRAFT_318942 [Cladorrhinum sp. PSN259]
MHLILTGATGLVGTAVLNAMIKTPEITKISVLSRRPVPLAEDSKDPRVNVIIHKDFSTYPREVLDKLQGADACVWALGISQTQVNKEDYISITKSYPLSFVKSLFSQSQSKPQPRPFKFIYISGLGATFSPGRFTPVFGRVKGETELALAEIQNESPTAFKMASLRLAFVDWLDQPEIRPYLPETITPFRNVVGGVFQPLLKYGLKGSWTPTEVMGRFVTGMAMGRWEDELAKVEKEPENGMVMLEGGMRVIENGIMWRLLGKDGSGNTV